MKFTAIIGPMTDGTVFAESAVAGLVGQRPMVHMPWGTPARTRGEITDARLFKDGTITLTLEVRATDLMADVETHMVMGYSMNSSTITSDHDDTVHALTVFELLPKPADLQVMPVGHHRHASWMLRDSSPPTPPVQRTFQEHLRFAIADPGAFVGRRLHPSWREGNDGYAADAETIPNWSSRAVLVVVRERDRLVRFLSCSQCGKQLNATACGPTHAVLSDDPWQHVDAPEPPWGRCT